MTPSPDEKTEAKVCPFCDKEPTMIKAFDKPVAVCQSEGCALAGFWVALKQWNRRTPAQAAHVDKVLAEQQGEIAELNGYKVAYTTLRDWCEEEEIDFDLTLPEPILHNLKAERLESSLTASLERVKELEKEKADLKERVIALSLELAQWKTKELRKQELSGEVR